MWIPLLIVSIAVGAVLVAATSPMRPLLGDEWRDGQINGRWRTAFSGSGSVSGNNAEVRFAPKSATRSDQTHAAMVVSTDRYTAATFTTSITTTDQLRQKDLPNPWEVGWVVWQYHDNSHFYAFVPKPNGWELTKHDPAYPGGRHVLLTGERPDFPVGKPHQITVRFDGPTATVLTGDRVLTAFTDTERPYLDGSVGLYSADAAVTFDQISITPVR